MIATIVARTKVAAASLTDALAKVGERLPGISQLTVTAAGVTVVPSAPVQVPALTPARCPSCGRSEAPR